MPDHIYQSDPQHQLLIASQVPDIVSLVLGPDSRILSHQNILCVTKYIKYKQDKIG